MQWHKAKTSLFSEFSRGCVGAQVDFPPCNFKALQQYGCRSSKLVIGERVSVDPDKLTLHDRATDFVYVYASVATISPVNRYQV